MSPKGRGKASAHGRRRWSAEEDALLRQLYPDTLTATVAQRMRRSISAIYGRVDLLGLAKSPAYLASPDACRLRSGDNVGARTRYPKGHVPANKGTRRPGWAPGRMRETQFKKGERQGVAAKLYKPIGSERISKDGYLERKVNDDLPLQARWRAVHLILWESVHGRLPRGYAIVFKNGDKTDIRLDNLERITRGELMLRNTVHRYPKPIVETIQLIGAVRRKINRRTRSDEKQDRGPAEPSVRHA